MQCRVVFYFNAETLCAQLRYFYASLDEAAVILIPLCEKKKWDFIYFAL